MDVFRESGAMLNGHFILTSGLRSPVFLQKARVFMHADRTEKLCRALADKRIRADVPGDIDYVVVDRRSAASFRPTRPRAISRFRPSGWSASSGTFRLRRFEIEKGARVVIVEDIVTTGLSSRETVECDARARRRGGRRRLPHRPLRRRGRRRRAAGGAGAVYEVPAYPADALPPELAAIPAVKPGSRNM
jgi:orotate phosphoribosyltransferase